MSLNAWPFSPVSKLLNGGRLLAAGVSMALLGACSGGANQPQPAQLKPFTAMIPVQQAWTAKLGDIDFPLTLSASANTVMLAAGNGLVLAMDAGTGRDLWRINAGAALAAGVGGDARLAAVVTRGNELVTMADGKIIWRQKLLAQSFTAPFVAGGRVFVLAADRTVSAFDGATGSKLWTQQRPGEPLVLRQGGVLQAVGNTLVAGLGGRLTGLNPDNGSVRWELPIAIPRGVNDIERLVDLVGPASRLQQIVCVRAFQASVGCVNAERGSLLWSRPADGSQGLDGDERLVFGVESDGRVIAWQRADGERAWTSDELRYRGLTAPHVVGRSIAIGDASGFVHLLSRQDGSLLNRLSTDGSAIVASPVLVGDTLVVVTRKGHVFGFQPQ
ncbi:MAG: outer membrane protein assembly factor BamB [Rhodoferax sp.]|nr:outer membrane protein assembly factor BamB [Rhodoferax sp.]